ncbi:BTAD domain-containing putative transcriptional regulator [Dactylosporangium sp. NPDC051541]|uniref:AfsR/SARP family transcriptional regulator n=1 Tax=Dactylosporangium sp. NPDC051541 TaxID=3363977 RepID=UPI0037A4991D
MLVRLLGPIDVVVDGRPAPLPGVRRRTVLAVLALRAGEVVSTDRLIDAVWGDQPPSTALNTLQRHVSYLRQVLGHRDAIVARAPGYLLVRTGAVTGGEATDGEATGGEITDAEAAQRLVALAEAQADPSRRAGYLRDALALWRGRPLADVAERPGLSEEAERLEQLRLHATRLLLECRLAVGEHDDARPELARLAAEYPFDERLHALLMLALYRGGRPGDALAVGRRLRAALADELGLDPGPAIQDLETAILRRDPALGVTPPPVPAQLPPALPMFAGRSGVLAELDGLLAAMDTTAVVISAVSGMAGVGKTTLAVYWAHRVADRFPDGQLYLNLRGFDPDSPPMTSAEVLRQLLTAVGVAASRIAPDPDAQAAQWRGEMSGRRMLVLLDNVRDTAQVRPVLPGGPGTLVLVTGRGPLTGLAAAGAHPVALDLLTPDEARDLLARRLGAERVASEPRAVDEIIARCARLPLALAIVAARAATRPHLPLAALVRQLRAAEDRLDVLSTDDPRSDIRAVFACSYGALTAPAQRLFRLLGLHPGPDVAVSAAAGLAGLPVARTRALLAELSRANLVAEPAADRYSLHDLVREYAAELAHAADPDDDRRAAQHRLLDHYLHTAHAASGLLFRRLSISLGPARPGSRPQRLPDDRQALSWFAAEHPVLLAAIGHAARTGFDEHAWRLAYCLSAFLDLRGHWHDWAEAQQTALAAAGRLGDPGAQAQTLRQLAGAHTRLGRYAEAHTHLTRALELFGRAGDPGGQAQTHHNLGILLDSQGRLTESFDHAGRALALFRAIGSRKGEADALSMVGWLHAERGEYPPALACCTAALPMHVELGNRQGEADTWDSLGYTHHHTGDYAEAVHCYEQGLAVWRDLGDRYNEADLLGRLGETLHASGDPDEAGRAWHRALSILESLGHPDAAAIRAKLVLIGG